MDANDEAIANGICFPYDVLLDILRRVPGRALAASARLVCRSWRGIVDAHGLLLPHVFPREFPGIFATYYGFYPRSALFAPPASRDPQLFWDDWHRVRQHCNGLFLLENRCSWRGPDDWHAYVCNPATLRSARLPPMPSTCGIEGVFLAFDPAVSRHHEVFYFPTQERELGSTRVKVEELEEQPSLFGEEYSAGPTSQSNMPETEEVLHVLVFSSRNGEWEIREFKPAGRCTSGHLYDVVTAPRREEERRCWSAEYWRGSLYVQCHGGVLMILHCSNGTYTMVQLPGHPCDDKDLRGWSLPKRCISASRERGICYVVLKEFQLRVWELTGTAEDQLGWTLAHEANLEARNCTVNYLTEKQKKQPRMTWELVESDRDLITLFEVENIDDVDGDDSTEEGVEEEYVEANSEANSDEAHAEEEEEQDNVDDTQSKEEDEEDNYHEARVEEEEEQDSDEEDGQLGSGTGSEYSWNSDEHNFINFDKSDEGDEYIWGWGVTIVGFHPYKDVLLLKFSDTVVAYHLQTSRMQYLGYIYPRRFCQNARDVHGAFPYRPCYIDALPPRKTSQSS